MADAGDDRTMSGWGESARGAAGRRLLHELVERLGRLIEADEPSHFDLTAMELGEADHALLRDTLGEGEIMAEVSNFGRVSVMESGYAGIWWVTHLDEEEQVLSEFLEVSYCPEVLIAEMETVADGLNALKARLFEMEMARKRV
ncbi:MAG: hydrogenase expression/formation protein [Gammaproteobacteria bacterium]|nr:hydrogenase expression/formation protein [Gammaproteobacteria bacterium]